MFVLYCSRTARFLTQESSCQVGVTHKRAKAALFKSKKTALVFRDKALKEWKTRKLFTPIDVHDSGEAKLLVASPVGVVNDQQNTTESEVFPPSDT